MDFLDELLAAFLAQVLNFLGIVVKGSRIIPESKHRPVNLGLILGFAEEVLHPVKVSAIARSEVVHDAPGRKGVVQEVDGGGDEESTTKQQSGLSHLIDADAQSNIGGIACFLQLLHALSW